MINNLQKTYQDKKVLITGHTGFKGSWLSLWLNKMGAETIGISSNIPSNPSNFESSDLANFMHDYRFELPDSDSLKKVLDEHKPDFIFHLAAQALVKESYNHPTQTMMHNAIGSASVLESLIDYKDELVLVMITSDKVYDNVEWQWGYRENDLLGGSDPYSASKGMAELAIKSFINSYFADEDHPVKIAIGRAGNVIGGGDWVNDRVVPDAVRAAANSGLVTIRSPNSTRPWQHVLEPLSGYLLLAQNLSKKKIENGEAFNFGPKNDQNFTVLNLLEELSIHWSKVCWELEDNSTLHEAQLLKLNIDKALMDLSWSPTLDFEMTVKMTAEWYKTFYDSGPGNMREFSESQIDQYTTISEERGSLWACENA